MKKYACSIAKYGINNQLCVRKGNQGLNDKEMCKKCKLEYLNHLKLNIL